MHAKACPIQKTASRPTCGNLPPPHGSIKIQDSEDSDSVIKIQASEGSVSEGSILHSSVSASLVSGFFLGLSPQISNQKPADYPGYLRLLTGASHNSQARVCTAGSILWACTGVMNRSDGISGGRLRARFGSRSRTWIRACTHTLLRLPFEGGTTLSGVLGVDCSPGEDAW